MNKLEQHELGFILWTLPGYQWMKANDFYVEKSTFMTWKVSQFTGRRNFLINICIKYKADF